jgi:hypothetical protein
MMEPTMMTIALRETEISQHPVLNQVCHRFLSPSLPNLT